MSYIKRSEINHIVIFCSPGLLWFQFFDSDLFNAHFPLIVSPIFIYTWVIQHIFPFISTSCQSSSLYYHLPLQLPTLFFYFIENGDKITQTWIQHAQGFFCHCLYWAVAGFCGTGTCAAGFCSCRFLYPSHFQWVPLHHYIKKCPKTISHISDWQRGFIWAK